MLSREARRRSVIYQIYPRSFADSNGDGIGDLRGIAANLGHIKSLGADAIWLNPIFRSPQYDMGYDVSDYREVAPEYGSVADVDAVIAAAHRHGLEVLLDFVPSHTSIEHPWFREHPDWYIWADGESPPNNWGSVFGGPAWTRDQETGRWYMHSFYPEQPDLNWRNPEVLEAVAGDMKFWVDRGVDGFRLDAVCHMGKDEQLRDEPLTEEARGAGEGPSYRTLQHIYTKNLPEVVENLKGLRDALPGAFLLGETSVSAAELPKYLEPLDLGMYFDFLKTPTSAELLRSTIQRAKGVDGIAWHIGSHDLERVATRWPKCERVAAMVQMTLPGAALIYQGEEIGQQDGSDHGIDRYGRDVCRHPMQWNSAGGFTTGEPWLDMTNPSEVNVEGQERDRGSMLWLYRDLIALHHQMQGEFALTGTEGVLEFQVGEHLVAANFSDEPRSAHKHGEVLLTTGYANANGEIPAHSGFVARVG